MTMTSRRKVGYLYDPDVGNFYYAQGHPMKPHRMRMTHNLLVAYGLFDRMDVLTTPRATDRDMTRFHSDEYINFLRSVTLETLGDQVNTLCRFNVLEDCPVFDGLWEYCQIAAGGSLTGATRLNSGENTVCINWAGGLHHAKKAEASGFCYINDCVLAILELLKVHARVLYVDIDIHHGDGVEEAFYTTDRVMTASFHKFGDYFPGTGDAGDIGIGRGKHYSANFPLRDGIDDDSYREIFVPVMSRIMEWYQPGAVVLQCGADSLSGDRLGCFNLSLFGHAQCVDFFKRYDVPLLLLGGGGYTVRNVARCWAYETSRVVGATLSDELPFNENYEFYGPDFRLHITPSNMENHNSRAELERTKVKIIENLRNLPHAPSTPFMDTPRVSPIGPHRRDDDSDDEDPDVRHKNRRAKTVIDYAGSDDEDDDQYISSLRYAKRRGNRLNFPRRRVSSPAFGVTAVDKSNSGIPALAREDYSPRRPCAVTSEHPPPLPALTTRTDHLSLVHGQEPHMYTGHWGDTNATVDKKIGGLSNGLPPDGGLAEEQRRNGLEAGSMPKGSMNDIGHGSSDGLQTKDPGIHGGSEKHESEMVGAEMIEVDNQVTGEVVKSVQGVTYERPTGREAPQRLEGMTVVGGECSGLNRYGSEGGVKIRAGPSDGHTGRDGKRQRISEGLHDEDAKDWAPDRREERVEEKRRRGVWNGATKGDKAGGARGEVIDVDARSSERHEQGGKDDGVGESGEMMNGDAGAGRGDEANEASRVGRGGNGGDDKTRPAQRSGEAGRADWGKSGQKKDGGGQTRAVDGEVAGDASMQGGPGRPEAAVGAEKAVRRREDAERAEEGGGSGGGGSGGGGPRIGEPPREGGINKLAVEGVGPLGGGRGRDQGEVADC